MKNAKEILDPILDLMSGSDGGAAFARLQFQLLPEYIRMSEEGSVMASDAVKAFNTVSKFCKFLLENK